MTQHPRMLANRYEVRNLIGRGGMADVHAGFDTRLGREVAIKILRSELARDPSFLQRFRREAQAAAGLNHPSIVAVFDSGEDSHTDVHGTVTVQPFIVMEYVHGTTLRERLSADGVLPAAEACEVMAQVLHALEYSHRHGIVHRDIKPGNVMVTPTGVAKVMDFGIARAIADSAATMTNTSVVIGTAQYLSPEQAQGREIDARSDIYSAGCLLYELITGRAPFIGESPVAIAYQHVGEPPQPPSVFNPDVPGKLDTVVLHSLAKEPEKRYQTAAEFASDLEAVVREEATLAESAALAAGVIAVPKSRLPETSNHSQVVTVTEEPQRRKRGWLLPLLVALAVIATLVGALYSQGVFDRAPAQVAVPSLVDKTDQEAEQLLAQAQLLPGKQTAKNAAKAGTVVSQEPTQGAQAPVGSTVTYVVSSGPGVKKMPDLRNFDQATARQMLADNDLGIGKVNAVDTKDVQAGNVVSTEPKAGAEVKEGTAVTLNISTGRVVVPNVIGLSREAAMEKLSAVGLNRQFIPVPGTKKPGTILSQSYKEGEKVPVGTMIELTVVDEPIPTRTVTLSPTPTPTPTPTAEPTPTDVPSPEDTTEPPAEEQ
ncbi:MAG: Stk1 family PASTA domain-containing Ser/Thr kinase [Dermatophilus congolensis]|nr:Stk1 family PASTA domain-containing Ser/Thr kinase [Dermatophilus congolensis]